MITTEGSTLADRVDALAQAAVLAHGTLPDEQVAAASLVAENARERLRHGTEHTVVAIAGPTGVGKSTLFNALCGEELSTAGVLRPTTGVTHACVWGPRGAELLDWLGVGRRHHLDVADDDPLSGLVLLDLPDFDSTQVDHRLEVDGLIEMVDLMVWVSDPQKYADESLHMGYLRPLADHHSVMSFVLNRIDTVSEEIHGALLQDFERRLTEDGIAGAAALGVAATTGAGLSALRALLAERVVSKEAAVARVQADLAAVANELRSPGGRTGLDRRARDGLVDALGKAAGSDRAADIAAAQYRSDAARQCAWTPLRLLRRRRRQPVADLAHTGHGPTSSAEIATALRGVGETAGRGLGGPWPAAIRRAAMSRQEPVEEALRSATNRSVRAGGQPPGWWNVVRALQGMLALTAAVGLLWLLAAAVLGGFLKLDTEPLLIDTPGADWIPLPSLLLLGATTAGLLTGSLARIPAGLGARRRARRVRGEVREAVAHVARQEVLDPVEELLDERLRIEHLLGRAAGRE